MMQQTPQQTSAQPEAPQSPQILRKGATRQADMSPELIDALSRGEMACATLTECLAVDQKVLVRVVFPDLPQHVLDDVDAACALGILKRMGKIGAVLYAALGDDGVAHCQTHHADMVRGWACFMIGAKPGLDIPERLAAIRPLADDAHFGVREWAWMAVRAHLVEALPLAITHLQPWTASTSPYIRRFASEVLRPRGVWCAHIATLKKTPQLALPILSALSSDDVVYVQDSVANWLNDAGKDQPEWIRTVCAQWLQGDASPATQRICQRALRHVSS